MATDLKELLEIVPSLDQAPEETQQAYITMYDAMTKPPKGMDPENWRWSPDVVKIRHRMTSDSAMPEEAAIGDVWSANRVLWSAKEDGKEKPFRFVPFKRWLSHARFVKGSTRPDCTSMDAKTGFGDNGTGTGEGPHDCNTCPQRPWADGKKTDCMRSQNYYVFDLDNTCIRMINFSKSNYKAGSVIVDVSSTKNAIWDTVFGVTTKIQSAKDYEYPVYVLREVESQQDPWVAEFCDHAYDMLSARRDEAVARMKQRALAAEEALQGPAPALEDLEDAEEVDGFDDM